MVKIRQNLVSQNKYSIKCPYSMDAEFIVVHNTANDASANNEISYMISNNNKVSFHYAIDDVEIVQGIPENRNAWHSGDGSSGNGNRKGIAIEICYSKSGGKKFDKAEDNAAEFIASKLKEKSWGIDKVKKHQDFDNKYCPHRTLDYGWKRFLDKIRNYMKENVVMPDSNKEEFEVAKTYQNGSTKEVVYSDSSCSKIIGSLNAWEKCDCLGIVNGRYIVKYKIDGTNNYKVGFVIYNGGINQ